MFQQLKRLTSGKQLPMVATSSITNEKVVIECGSDGTQDFFRTITAQTNGWNRINTYYADGSTDETYEK